MRQLVLYFDSLSVITSVNVVDVTTQWSCDIVIF